MRAASKSTFNIFELGIVNFESTNDCIVLDDKVVLTDYASSLSLLQQLLSNTPEHKLLNLPTSCKRHLCATVIS